MLRFEILWSVLCDLWDFVWGRDQSVGIQLRLPAATATQPQVTPLNFVQPSGAVAAENPMQFLQSATPDERYVVAARTPVSMFPYQGFDTTLSYVSFGDSVTVRSYQGSYAQIMTATGPGWVKKDSLVAQRSTVWPTLTVNDIYQFDSTATQLVRKHVKNAFNTEVLRLPLQSVEYVSYRLLQSRRVVNWGPNRPRVPGVWQQLLKGRSGIHIGVQPLADSVMEYCTDAGEGVLYYVEAVTPDNTVLCSTVGLVVAGQYTSHAFPVSYWRELRPVFIDVIS